MKTVTKLIAVFCVVLMLASLAACGGGADSGSIVGSWEYEAGGFTYTFNADGTGSYDAAGTVMNFTYETNDNMLNILYDGMTTPWITEYEIDGDTLNVHDVSGSDTIYKRK